ncbi:hypothetical protein B0G75_103499 [Paraburkholderia sp. BL18I3N2]|nr:hypothetical protein B0G75_103499 [Paraburkholderia sp. BL18I3N2]
MLRSHWLIYFMLIKLGFPFIASIKMAVIGESILSAKVFCK